MNYTLTINISNLVSGWNPGIPVILSSISFGNQNVNLPGFGAYRVLQPNNDGVITVDIPPSPDYNNYQLDISGQRFIFIMPEQNSDLENLLVTQIETHPWFVSSTIPNGPNRDGDIWVDIHNENPAIKPEIKVWASNQWNTISGSSSGNGANVSNDDLDIFDSSSEPTDVAPSRQQVAISLHQAYLGYTGEGFQDNLNSHIHDSPTIIKAYDDAGNEFRLLLNNDSVAKIHLVTSQALPENASEGDTIKKHNGVWEAVAFATGGASLTNEQFQDKLNDLISNGVGISKSYDDDTNIFKLDIDLTYLRNTINSNDIVVANYDHRTAMRYEYNLITNYTFRQATGNAANRVASGSWPNNSYDRLVTVAFTDTNTSTVYESDKIKLSDIYLKLASNGIQLSTSNAIKFTKNGATFSVSREGLSGILVAADDTGDYRVTIKIDEPDIAEFARLSITKKIPNDKLNTASSTVDGIVTATKYRQFDAAISIDTSSLTSSDSGSFAGYLHDDAGFGLISFSSTDIETEFDAATGQWSQKGYRDVPVLPAGTILDNLPIGTLRFQKGIGVFRVSDAVSGKVATAAFTWHPVRAGTQPDYGFDTRPNEANFGIAPTGWPAGSNQLIRDRNNRIWCYAASGIFSHQGMVITVGNNVWHLKYDETSGGIDVFFSETKDIAPWTDSQITFNIHAIGAQPFTGTGKHLELVDHISTGFPSWWQGPDTPEPDSKPTGITTLPTIFVKGDKYLLLERDIFQPHYTITLDNDFNAINIGGSEWSLRRDLTNHSIFALWAGGTTFNAPTEITINGTPYTLTHIAGRQYRINNPPISVLTAGAVLHIWWQTTLDSPDHHFPAATAYEPGYYQAVTTTRLDIVPGNTAYWALNGFQGTIPSEFIPTFGSRIIKNNAGPGLSVTSTASNFQSNTQAFVPVVDLDVSPYSSGTFGFDCTFQLSQRSNVTDLGSISFNQDKDVSRIELRGGYIFSSSIKSASAYSNSAQNGVDVFSIPIFSGSGSRSKVSTIVVYIVKNNDTDNEAEIYVHHDGISGLYSFALGIPKMRVLFLPSDPG